LFKATLKINTLRELAKIPSSIVKEVRTSISPAAIEIAAVDSAQIAMLSLNYTDKVFSGGDVSGEPSLISFELDKLDKTLSLGKPDSTVDFTYDSLKNIIVLRLGDIIRNMTLLSVDASKEIPSMPKISLPNYVILKVEELLQGISGAQIVAADEIEIILDPQSGFTMHSQNKGDVLDVHIPKERLAKFDIKNEVKSLYPLNILRDLLNELKGIEQIVLFCDSDKPLRLQFDLSGGVGTGKFLLAPRTREMQ
jgi:proliferating cell nuclear antigen